MTPIATTSDEGAPVASDRVYPRDALLAWMQEIAPYGILTTDTDLRIRGWNHWLTTHSGFSAEKVVGKLLLEVFPDLVSRRLDEYFKRALAGEVSVLSSALHKYLLPFAPTSREYDVPQMLQTARIAPLPAGTKTVGTIIFIEDVTQRDCHAVTLQRQQDRDRLLSMALGILLQSNDPFGDVAEIFPKIAPSLGVEAYFDYAFDEDSRTLRLKGASGVPPKHKELMATLAVGERVAGQVAADRQPIVINHIQSSDSPLVETQRAAGLRLYCCFPLIVTERFLGTISFGSYSRDALGTEEVSFLSTLAQYLAIAVERTQREAALNEAQHSLREHADSLETRVHERTARLHDTIAQLESFSYTVAHDLRAPIRALKGYSEVLLADHGHLLPEEARVILDRLHRASDRLDALTRDLLKFTKVARADVELIPIDVEELVRECAQISPTLEQAVLVQRPLGIVFAQRTLLQQCFSNLFDNALKFATPGVRSRIVVRSELVGESTRPIQGTHGEAFNPPTRNSQPSFFSDATKRNEVGPPTPRTFLRVWIEDNGIGIPAHAHNKIFGIFERGAGLGEVEGTGIGLAIVASAMQQMGGTCGVESELGHGSRFWLELVAT